MVWSIHSVSGPFLRHFRARRIELLYRLLGIGPRMRVLDVGGHSEFWGLAEAQGLPLPRVTIANLQLERDRGPAFDWVVADGCQLPFRDGVFDAALSNSVIEHLGDVVSQARFAAEIERVARLYFVETPNRRFPVEPHLATPFLHWLPPRWQRALIRNCTVWGILMRPTRQQCVRFLCEVRLLDFAEMRRLFPNSRVIREKTLGMTKSLIAARGAQR